MSQLRLRMVWPWPDQPDRFRRLCLVILDKEIQLCDMLQTHMSNKRIIFCLQVCTVEKKLSYLWFLASQCWKPASNSKAINFCAEWCKLFLNSYHPYLLFVYYIIKRTNLFVYYIIKRTNNRQNQQAQSTSSCCVALSVRKRSASGVPRALRACKISWGRALIQSILQGPTLPPSPPNPLGSLSFVILLFHE